VEGERFDQLARHFGKASTRRAALGRFASGTVVSALGIAGAAVLAGNEEALAKKQCNGNAQCKNPKNPCKKGVCKHGKCRKKNVRNGKSCGDEQVCQNGRCQSACSPACTGGQICEQAVCVCPESGQCTITPSSLDGWTIVPGGEVEFVEGPETPLLGTGSVRISTIDVTRSTIANASYDGLDIADIESLGYSTYMVDGGPTGVVVPAIKLPVLFNNGTQFATLIFEPTYSENSDVVADEWQTWDALSADARWWSSRALPSDICAFDCFVPWDDIKAAIPDAFITGALLIETGSGTDDADGNVDALHINGMTFDFDPDPE
jgi:hypothetical protein